MLINAQLIKEQRIDRGWTQQQMAEVADLSLRTIQRIENQGVASNESVSALATVLELPRGHILLHQNQSTNAGGVERQLIWVTALAAAAGASIGAIITLVLTGAI